MLKDNFVLLTSVTALFYVPYALIMSLFTSQTGAPQVPSTGTLVAGGVGMLIILVVAPITQLAATRAASEVYLSSAPSLSEAYRSALKQYAPYMGTCLLLGVLLLGATLLFVIPGIIFGIAWSLVGPIAVVEGQYGWAALKRSRALVKDYWWRTFGVLMVVGVIAGIVTSGINMVLASIPFLGAALSGAVQAVSAAFGSVALLVVYVDLRCRHEDFDLQRLAGQVAASGTTQPVGPGPVRI